MSRGSPSYWPSFWPSQQAQVAPHSPTFDRGDARSLNPLQTEPSRGDSSYSKWANGASQPSESQLVPTQPNSPTRQYYQSAGTPTERKDAIMELGDMPQGPRTYISDSEDEDEDGSSWLSPKVKPQDLSATFKQLSIQSPAQGSNQSRNAGPSRPIPTATKSMPLVGTSPARPVPASRTISTPASKPKALHASPSRTNTLWVSPTQRFAESEFGTDLPPLIIAHDKEVQAAMDARQITWGTQFELARGVTAGAWTWNDVKARLQSFRSGATNADSAPKVIPLMRGQTSFGGLENVKLWQELDREQAALEEGIGRGLGLMDDGSDWKGIKNWYGGRIQQKVKLEWDKENHRPNLVLQPLEDRRSHRFARFYGSRRFIQIKIQQDSLRECNKEVLQCLQSRFILCGRSFVPFHPKDGSVYLVETDEDYERRPAGLGDEYRMSFQRFINWHNPLTEKKNSGQVIAKYSARFALGLSNSVPALEIEERDIHFLDDDVASDWDRSKKAPSDKLMTDGAGFINQYALMKIVKRLGYEGIPAAIQARFDGAKGMFVLHPYDRSDRPIIWIRDSQFKIKNGGYDRAHRILDLVAPSKYSGTSSITPQSILNLNYNGVPAETLVSLLEEGLTNEVETLVDWDRPNSMPNLWNAVNKVGNVSGSRTQRHASALARALGFKNRSWKDDEDADGDDEKSLEATTYTGRNKYSGSPLSLYESSVELIQVGFHPRQCPLLMQKLTSVVKTFIKKSIEEFSIPVYDSLSSYVIPDPIGVLKPGEIYYRFSRPRRDSKTEMLYQVLEGDVVVGRYPIYLPCDMQKVKAVDRPELNRWMDVIIIPTVGERSLANMLSGGDMDGDDLLLIWDPRLVKPFKNKPFTPPPDNLIADNFERIGAESVDAFCSRGISLIDEGRVRDAGQELIKVLTGQLVDDCKGMYSMFHDNAAANSRLSYDHPETIRLAYVFTTLLDASKTGLRLKPGLFEKDKYRYRGQGGKSVPTLPILQTLQEAGKKKEAELLRKYNMDDKPWDRKRKPPWEDDDLLKPLYEMDAFVQEVLRQGWNGMKEQLEKIKRHVDSAEEKWLDSIKPSYETQESQPSRAGGKKKKFGAKRSDQDDLALEAARMYAAPIPDVFLPLELLEGVKASYAFKKRPTFAFSVAFQDLCLIKAKASPGGCAPSSRLFDEGKTISSSFLRAMQQSEDIL